VFEYLSVPLSSFRGILAIVAAIQAMVIKSKHDYLHPEEIAGLVSSSPQIQCEHELSDVPDN